MPAGFRRFACAVHAGPKPNADHRDEGGGLKPDMSTLRQKRGLTGFSRHEEELHSLKHSSEVCYSCE